MSGRYFWIAVLLLVGAAVFVAVAFVLQNMGRTTDLSLDLYFRAWKTKDAIPIPVLIGACFGAGFALGFGWMGLGRMKQGRRIRQLEQQLALGREPNDAW